MNSVVHLNRLIERLCDANIENDAAALVVSGTPEPGLDMKNLYLETELGPIDFLGSILGIGDSGSRSFD